MGTFATLLGAAVEVRDASVEPMAGGVGGKIAITGQFCNGSQVNHSRRGQTCWTCAPFVFRPL